MDVETLKIIKEFGYGIVSLAFCFWLVREIVIKMGKSLDGMTTNLQGLTTRIEAWNKETENAHEYQRQEHKEILQKLDR